MPAPPVSTSWVGPSRLTRVAGSCSRPAAARERNSSAVPFLSQRYVVRAAELMAHDAAQNAATYAERFRAVMAALCDGFDTDTVNLVMTHGFVRGGVMGGGERDAQMH